MTKIPKVSGLPTASSVLLDIRNLVVTADGRSAAVVDDISLSLNRGEVLALIGASGSGKTTLALTALGYLRPGLRHVSGSVHLDGTEMLTASAATLRQLRGQKVAYVAQSAASAFNPRMRLKDQVIEPSMLRRTMDRIEARRRAVSMFRSLGLPDPESIAERFPHQVSGGQLQRFMIAMGLQESPALLICDEPTSALDVTTQVEVLNALKESIQKQKTSALFVSHDLAVVAQVATRIAVLRHGKLIEMGDVDQILHAPQQAYTRELLSSHRKFTTINPRATQAQGGLEPLLHAREICVGYGPLKHGKPNSVVLSDVSATVDRGEMLAIVGESGSGKSTFARAIAGLYPAFAGSVSVEGKTLAANVSRRNLADRKRVQMVFQSADTALNPRQTASLILGRTLQFFEEASSRNLRAKIVDLLGMVELPAVYAERTPSQLSGGEKQRLNLARALAAKPDVLICDEITSALDNLVAESILDLVDRLRRELRIAVLFVSHDLSAVASLSDQVIVLRGGHVVEQGETSSILSAPSHPYTRLLKESIPRLREGWLEDAANQYGILKKQLELHELEQI